MGFRLKIAGALTLMIAAHWMTPIAEWADAGIAEIECAFAALYLLAFAILYRSSGEWRPPWRALSLGRLAQAMGAGLALFVLGMLVYTGVAAAYARMGWDAPQAPATFNVRGIWQIAALLLFMTTIVLLEEFIFRGVILHRLRARSSAVGAILVSSICFSAYHLSAFQAAPTLVWGIGLGVLYLRTNSLLMPVIAHLTFNLLSVGLFISATSFGS